MQINSVNNNTPSFGMAKLTTKGQELVASFVSDVPDFIDTTCYRKNLIGSFLKKASTADEFTRFFEAGNTLYPSNNSKFIKKQVNGFRASGAIKRFLKRQASTGGDSISLSEKGKTLVDELIKLFDTNISNPEVSAKQGRKILNLVEPYVGADVLGMRSSVVTNKAFSK